jgi:glycosyltransferase involved in cell wall biosynthesis
MAEERVYPGRVGLQQRVLPLYRVPFVEALAARCAGGLAVFAGQPRPQEVIPVAEKLEGVDYSGARNQHLLWGAWYLCRQPDLIPWLARWDPQVLILEANPRYLSNLAALRWMRQRGRPVLGWGLGAGSGGPLGGLGRWLRSLYYRQFDALISYSSLGAQGYRQAGVDPRRVFVAPNAVAGPPGPYRPRPPLAGRQPRVLFVGRLQRRKRVDALLRACAGLQPQPELWVVGDGPERIALERLAARLRARAVFHGAVHGRDLDVLFEAADLFVLPGTGGLAVQQAMAHGLPVIVAEADGSQRDLVSGEAGWLVPPGDEAALREALRAALAEAEKLAERGRAARQVVAERANVEVMADRFVEAMMAVMKGPGGYDGGTARLEGSHSPHP